MRIEKIEIDFNFPEKLVHKIDEMSRNKDFSAIWQTIGWNLMLKKTGYIKRGTFLGVFEDEELLNFTIIENRDIGAGFNAQFILGGPNNAIGLDVLEASILDLAKKDGAVFSQIEPLDGYQFKKHFKKGYRKFIEKNTAIVSLEQDEEKILSNMKQKGRYNIKVAEKHGITVSKAEPTESNIRTFYDLLVETKQRDEFFVNSYDYFKEFINYAEENDLGGLYFAKKDDEVLAAGIFLFHGKTAFYYYGASTSSNEKRRMMPAYALQWSLIKEAKDKGMKYFDFLGIADPEDPDSHLAGVTDFKLKLTNETKRWPDEKVFVNKKLLFFLVNLKWKLKKFAG